MKNIHDTANRAIAVAKKMKPIDEWIRNLSDAEVMYLETIINANVNNNLKILADSVTNAITDFLYEHNFDVNAELDKLEAKINAENDMITKYLKRGEDYMKMLEKDREKIINDYEKMIKESSEKDTMKNLIQDYSPKYSATTVRNVVNAHKDSLKKKKTDNSSDNDKEIKDALEYIFGDDLSADKDDVKEEQAKKDVIKQDEIKNTAFKKAGEILKDDEGTLYYKIDKTVTVGTMTFKNEKDIEEFRDTSLKEYDDAYEKEAVELKKAYEEKKVKFLKKVHNIFDVMEM